MHGFAPAEDVSGLEHFSKHLDLGRFKLRLEGQIGTVKVSKHPIPLETGRLLLDGFLCEFGGALPQRDGRKALSFLGLHSLQDLELNGKAVTIPSGDIVHLLALEDLMAVDEVLQELVEGMANVQVAIGVRRSVVKDVPLGAGLLGIGAQLVVQINRFPVLLQLRLALDGVGALREGSLGKDDGRCVGVLLLLLSSAASLLLAY